jgi:hypothetical protein
LKVRRGTLQRVDTARPHAADAHEDPASALKDAEGAELLTLSIGHRKAFPNAAAAGKATTEQTANDDAAKELPRQAWVRTVIVEALEAKGL